MIFYHKSSSLPKCWLNSPQPIFKIKVVIPKFWIVMEFLKGNMVKYQYRFCFIKIGLLAWVVVA